MKKTALIFCAFALCFAMTGCGEKTSELQPIEIPEKPIEWGNHVSGYYKSAEQLDSGNPWRAGMNIERLPVYLNGSFNEAGTYSGLDEDAMIKRMSEAMEKCGDGASHAYERMDFDRDGKTDCIFAISGTAHVEVQANGSVQIFDTFVPPSLELLTKPQTEQAEVADEIGRVLLDRLGGYLNFSSPRMAISTSYLSGNPLYCMQDYYVFDDSGDDVQNILNYNFSRAKMGCSSDGVMLMANDLLCASHKLGDYPIISADDARKMISDAHVVYTELVYNTSPQEKILVPYYCFWVQADDYKPQDEYEKFIYSTGVYDDMTMFETRYVPAISPEYIAD